MVDRSSFYAYEEGVDELHKTSRLRELLKELFASQRLAVLATQGGGQPYGSLVAFCEADDLKYLLFATNRGTRKYANLVANPRVAMLIDSRSNQESDFVKATAVTAIGIAEEVKDLDRERMLGIYLARHPHLAEFATSPDTALFRITVEDYKIVTGLQTFSELHIGQSTV